MTRAEESPCPDDASRALLERASRGDSAAIDQLLEQHLPGLRAYVRLKAGRELLARESSSDLVQSVCRDVLENAARFRYDGEGAFRKWLFTTALRKIADRYEHFGRQKRDAAREQSTGGDDALLEACRGFYTPSQQAAAREDLERLEQCFRALDEQKREVILLSRMVGLSHAQIAVEMGKSEVAVRKLLSRALGELAERMDG
jgi:RNA polymerase sigma factor (sigma-70 family)